MEWITEVAEPVATKLSMEWITEVAEPVATKLFYGMDYRGG